MSFKKTFSFSSIFYSFAKARWKGEVSREEPFFDQRKYDEWYSSGAKEKPSFARTSDEASKIISSLINDPYAFINFSDVPIVGTNYSSYFGERKQYRTPAGFYAFPISELAVSTTNFAKDKEYMTVLKSNPDRTFGF